MAISIATRLESYFVSYIMAKYEMSEIAETALLKAGDYFLDNLLQTRFTYAAHSLLNFGKRSRKWNKWKFLGKIPPDNFFNNQMVRQGFPHLKGAWTRIIPHPDGAPRPFDARGQLKDFTLGRKETLRSNMTVKGKSKGFANMVLQIKMPYPHPVNPLRAPELPTLSNFEVRRLGQIIHVSVREQIEAGGFQRALGARFSRGGYPIINAA